MDQATIKERAAILARCSSEENVCNQILVLKQYAHGRYLVDEDDIYGDNMSGSSAVTERVQLSRLMQNIEEGKKQYSIVLVQDITRLGKHPEQVQQIQDWFEERNIQLYFMDR